VVTMTNTREEIRMPDSDRQSRRIRAYFASLIFAIIVIAAAFVTGSTEFAVVATIVTGAAVIRTWFRWRQIS